MTSIECVIQNKVIFLMYLLWMLVLWQDITVREVLFMSAHFKTGVTFRLTHITVHNFFNFFLFA
jgi:hypothetical protein